MDTNKLNLPANANLLYDIAQEHGDNPFYETQYQLWIYNQGTRTITHQFQSNKDNLEEALIETFQQWKELHPESNLKNWEDFTHNPGDEELFIHTTNYGIIYPM